MPDEITDVTSESSTDATQSADVAAIESSTSQDGTASDSTTSDRPLVNIKAEFDRKMTKVERQLQEQTQLITALLGRMNQPAPTPDTSQRQYTDEELFTLSQQGSREAYDLLLNRRMEQRLAQERQQTQANTLVTGQLQALYARYPVLRDASAALTQAAITTKQVLVSQGWHPQHPATDVEAIKTAIADNPDLAAQAQTRPAQVRDASRAAAAGVQAGIDGTTTRREPAGKPKIGLSKSALELAKRMGVKDPIKAHERFVKLNEEGRVGLSPTTTTMLREE